MHRAGASIFILLLLAFAVFVRLAHLAATTGLGQRSSFHYEYVLVGERLLQYGTIVSPLIIDDISDAPSSLMPPLYASLVAGVYWLFGPDSWTSTLVLQIVNALAGGLAVWVTFLVARRLAGATAAWVAGVLTAAHPLLFGYTSFIWDTCLFTLATAVTLLWTLRLTRAGLTFRRMFLFGLWLGILALLNPALTAAYPIFVLWPLFAARGWRVRSLLVGVCASLLGWALAIAPWTVRNYVQFGDLRYIRGGLMLDVWLGVCPEADTAGAEVFRKQFPLPENRALRDHVAAIGEEEFIRECGERAIAAIRSDPVRFIRITLMRIADYWLGTLYTHARPGGGAWPESASRAALTAFLTGEVLLLLVCLAVAGRPRKETWWLLACAVVFSIVYCLTHVQVRFRAPMEPVLAVVIGLCVQQMIDRRANGRPQREGLTDRE